MAYELGVRLVGADLHSLRTLNSDQEYVQGTIRIQEEFNRIFPGLIKTRNVQDFSRDVFNSPDTFNLQIFQELHGRFSFEWGLRERDAHPLMYSDSQALKVPAFFKFRVLWEHQGDERLKFADICGYNMTDEGILEPLILSKKIETLLQKTELERFFNNFLRDLFNHYFENAAPSREEWVQTLFPHSTFNITYQEIESASLK